MKLTDIGFALAFVLTTGIIALLINSLRNPPKDRCPECRHKDEHPTGRECQRPGCCCQNDWKDAS